MRIKDQLLGYQGILNNKTFAKKLGISPQYLNDVQKGRRNMGLKRAVRIAKILKVKESYIIEGILQELLEQNGLQYYVSLESK